MTRLRWIMAGLLGLSVSCGTDQWEADEGPEVEALRRRMDVRVPGAGVAGLPGCTGGVKARSAAATSECASPCPERRARWVGVELASLAGW